jgi:hypothetical protein
MTGRRSKSCAYFKIINDMTKRDFFIAAIKLFGLLSLVTSVFSVIPSNISFALMEIDVLSVLWIMFAAIAVGGLFVLLVFKADRIVDGLRLDRGFDDDRIDLGSLKSTDIVKIGTFIIGGLLILQNIPAFLSHTLFAYKSKDIGMEYRAEDKFNWAVSAINLVVGYLLLVHYEFVANKINLKPQDETARLG